MKELIVQFIPSSFLILFAIVSSVSTVFSQNLPLQQRLDPKPLTILISIDGFKPLYLDRGVTPTLNELAAQGGKS
jgi:predicted AlkP superfamily pyrophosphatase or phosphodiesterase